MRRGVERSLADHFLSAVRSRLQYLLTVTRPLGPRGWICGTSSASCSERDDGAVLVRSTRTQSESSLG